MAKATSDLRVSLFVCLLICLKLLIAFGKTSAIIRSIGIAQLSLRSDKSLLRCDYQQESIKIANLAYVRNVGSDLKQLHGKAVILAWFSPKKRMGSVSSFVTVFPSPQVKLGIFSSCKGDPDNDFTRAGYNQDANMLWRS